MRRLIVGLFSASVFAISIVTGTFAAPPGDWQSELGREHPLVGKIFKVDSAESAGKPAVTEISADALVTALASATIPQLGEQHDNSDHHRWQAWLVGEIVRAKMRGPGANADSQSDAKSGAIVFEQFRSNQQVALDAFAAKPGGLADLKTAVDWQASGWAKYNYDPLLEAVLAAKLPIYAGDVVRDTIRAVAKQGAEVLPEAERQRLALDQPLGAEQDDASLTEIEEAHCGVMPKSALGGLAYAQRYRDASLADAALKAAAARGFAIVIAGNGHVRSDRGISWYLRQRAPERLAVSVLLREVEDDKAAPDAYLSDRPGGAVTADYIVFTPRAKRDDPCVKMRAKQPG
jgi:uncharacterized iron-regulated protein